MTELTCYKWARVLPKHTSTVLIVLPLLRIRSVTLHEYWKAIYYKEGDAPRDQFAVHSLWMNNIVVLNGTPKGAPIFLRNFKTLVTPKTTYRYRSDNLRNWVGRVLEDYNEGDIFVATRKSEPMWRPATYAGYMTPYLHRTIGTGMFTTNWTFS